MDVKNGVARGPARSLRAELGTGALRRLWLGSGVSRRPARIHMARSSTGLGPRLLYALILGAIIAASLALRVWDPTPVARLRALVFDTYQRLDRAPSTRPCPCVSISTRPRSRRSASGPGRERCWPISSIARMPAPPQSASICVSRARPHVARERAPLAEIGGGRDFARGDRQAPVKRPGLCRGDRKGPVHARFHRRAPGTSLPETKAGFAHGGDDPAVRTPITPATASSLKELQDKAQGSGSLNWIPSTTRSSGACPW